MRLGLNLGYWGAGGSDGVELAQEAERLGFDSVWTAEAYGSDGLTPLAWVGALTSKIKLGTGILQMPARTPANTAMTAATLDHAQRRTRPARPRPLRPAGRRGLARSALWQAAHAHARVRRDRPPHPGARGAAGLPGRGVSDPHPPAAPASASRSSSSCIRCARASPSTSPPSAPRTSSWRARSPTAGCPSSSRRRRRAPTSSRSTLAWPSASSRQSFDPPFDIAPTVTVMLGDDVDALPRDDQADARALHRRHGRQGTQLLQRPRLPLRLRRPPPTTSRTSTWPARSARPRRWSPTRWWTRSRSAAPRSASPNCWSRGSARASPR